ncbi:MAG: hypothetical protein JST44_24255 [Cyanobacteria bacterium SZAS LIN-5]|nr:hypothetical protein [Cyanobacteria bacterium SZAS LIN-5]RTL38109.1 MAG: hypothetical protein EKK48_22695 [Candidatus Melainabacteria bacterium]
MHNPLINMFASLVLFTGPTFSPVPVTPVLEPGFLRSHSDMVIGRPEDKLQDLLDQCTTSADIEKLANSFDAVAKLYEQELDHRNAEVCYLVAIRLMNMCLPKNSPKLAVEYERLAVHYSHVDQGELARIANLKALKIYKANGREFAVEQAVIEHNQAWLELYAGKNSAAEYYLKHCLVLLKSVLGSEHPLVGLVSSSLGELYMYNGNFQAAEKLLKNALEILPENSDMEEVNRYVRTNYNLVLERLGKHGEKVVHGQIK